MWSRWSRRGAISVDIVLPWLVHLELPTLPTIEASELSRLTTSSLKDELNSLTLLPTQTSFFITGAREERRSSASTLRILLDATLDSSMHMPLDGAIQAMNPARLQETI